MNKTSLTNRLLTTFNATVGGLLAGAAVLAVEAPIFFIHLLATWGEETSGWSFIAYLILPLLAYLKVAVKIEKKALIRTPGETVLVHSCVGVVFAVLAIGPANWGPGIGPTGFVALAATVWLLGHGLILGLDDQAAPEGHNPSAAL